jgi:hypothetical protein
MGIKRPNALSHSTAVFLGLLLFGMYFPSATLTPFQVYFVDPDKDFRYAPLYVMQLQFFKCLLCALGTLFTQQWYFYLSFSILLNGWLSLLNWRWGTCNIPWMNHWKAVYFLMAAWSGVCALVARVITVVTDESHWLPPLLLFTGWMAIGFGGQAHWTFYGEDWANSRGTDEFADMDDDEELKLLDSQGRMTSAGGWGVSQMEEPKAGFDGGATAGENETPGQGDDPGAWSEFRLRVNSTSSGVQFI